MDAPPVFAAILDDEKGGHFSICPDAGYDASHEAVVCSVARYLYDRELAERIEQDARHFRLVYTKYDWRLNR